MGVKGKMADGKLVEPFQSLVDETGATLDLSDLIDNHTLLLDTLMTKTVVTVDSSGGGTATETAITTVPADSLLILVHAEVLVAMDGDTTTTLEVGLTGNIDQYIDTVDFDPSAVAGTKAVHLGGTTNDNKLMEHLASATPIVATWTNTASATAGSTQVTVIYMDLS